jgi:hypothetical protein
MPTDRDVSGHDPRDEARQALTAGMFGSVKGACSAVAGIAVIAGVVGSGFAALQKFDLTVFLTLCYVVALSGPVAFVVFELARLRNHSQLLRDVLASEKYYDTLIAETRKERDSLRAAVTEAEARLQVFMAVRAIVGQEDREELPAARSEET